MERYYVMFNVPYSRKSGKETEKYCLTFFTKKEANDKVEELKEIGGVSRVRMSTERPKDFYRRKSSFQ